MLRIRNIRRLLFVIYGALTALILVFTVLYGIGAPAQYLKFGVRLSMLLTLILLKKKYLAQRLLVPAFVCTVISDYFFVLLRVLNPDFANRNIYGMLGFILAYLFLIAAFQKNVRFGKMELLTLVPFVLIFSLVLWALARYAEGLMFWAAIFLGIVLSYAGMTMVATVYRGYFRKEAAWRIALSGCILFASDMVVAFSIFHPEFQGYILWKENLIWTTYMAGWLLLLTVAPDEQLLA